jgi:hypothetical protein
LRIFYSEKFAAFLRDNFDVICSRRREMTTKDFDWRRCFRVYQQTSSTGLDRKSAVHSTISSLISTEPIRMQVLDDMFAYGNEFYGIQQTLCITPATEKSFLGIWLALSFKRPVLVQGNAAVGKIFTIMVFVFFCVKEKKSCFDRVWLDFLVDLWRYLNVLNMSMHQLQQCL